MSPTYKSFKEQYEQGLSKCLIELLQGEVDRIAAIQYPGCFNEDMHLWVSRLFD